MSEKFELAGDPSRQNRTVSINKPQLRPHRCAARARDLAYRTFSIVAAIGVFGGRIDREIQPAGIQWFRLGQFLRKIVFGHAAISRNTSVSREQNAERHN